METLITETRNAINAKLAFSGFWGLLRDLGANWLILGILCPFLLIIKSNRILALSRYVLWTWVYVNFLMVLKF